MGDDGTAGGSVDCGGGRGIYNHVHGDVPVAAPKFAGPLAITERTGPLAGTERTGPFDFYSSGGNIWPSI